MNANVKFTTKYPQKYVINKQPSERIICITIRVDYHQCFSVELLKLSVTLTHLHFLGPFAVDKQALTLRHKAFYSPFHPYGGLLRLHLNSSSHPHLIWICFVRALSAVMNFTQDFCVVFICSAAQSLRGSQSQNHFSLSGGLSWAAATQQPVLRCWSTLQLMSLFRLCIFFASLQ